MGENEAVEQRQAGPPEETLTLERAAERLLEDERLRSALTDDEAQVLLDWALAALNDAVRRGEAPAAAVARLRATGRAVNDLVGARHDLDPATFAMRLRRLAGLPDPGPLGVWRRWFGRGDAVDALLPRLAVLDGPALIRAVLALLPPVADPEARP